MLHRLLRLALPIAAGIALLAAVTAEFGYAREATGLGLLALAIALAAGHLRLDKLERRMALVARQGRQRGAEQERLAALLDRNRDVVRRQGEHVRREIAGVRRHLDQLPSDTAYLQRLVAQTADPAAPLPALGGWAATARSILDDRRRDPESARPGDRARLRLGVVDRARRAAAPAARAGGHVYALEADPEFAEETRGYLRAHGADEYGAVVDAPLTDVTLPDGSTVPWYDLARLPDIGEIDILFVDGPIGTVADQARYPAFPLLADRLADGALIVVDDTNRRDEKQIVRRWLDEEYAGRRVTRLRTHGRATLLRVVRTS